MHHREIFGLSQVWDAVEALDNKVAADVQTDLRLRSRRLVERGSRWLLGNRPQPVAIAETIESFRDGVARVWDELPKLLKGADLDWYHSILDELTAVGVPDELAVRVAGFSSAFPALDIVAIADRTGKEPLEVAEVYYDLADRLRITQLMDRIIELPRDDRWQSMARACPSARTCTRRTRRSRRTCSASATARPRPGGAVPGVGGEERGDPGPFALHAGGDPGVRRVRPGEPVGRHADDADAAAYARLGVGRRTSRGRHPVGAGPSAWGFVLRRRAGLTG
ncbi:hypothetical protein SCALM49S_07678 [Streptomyces californicus]